VQIYTPRGLKIRLEVEYGFALMKRLYPEVDAFKILKTTEGLELLPSAVTFIAIIIAFIMRLEIVQIATISFLSYFLSYMITFWGLFIIPGLPTFGTLYSYISGYGVAFIIIVITGYVMKGLYGIIAFIIGRILAGIICSAIEAFEAKRMHNKFGITLMGSEKNFINAYRLHANKLGITTDVSATDEEMLEENWIDCFKDLAKKYPQVVNKFR